MGIVRTVLGDISPADMGVTYSHEHIIIEDSYPTATNPDFLLNDVEKIAAELSAVYAAGGRTMVDTMPVNCGRNVTKLAAVSRRSGVHILAPTGLHLEMYYPPTHWRFDYSEDELAALFIADIEEGIDAFDYNGPLVRRTAHRAGLIKLATGDEAINNHQRMVFGAVAKAYHATGAPILTHTNAGLHAVAQAELFQRLGVDLAHVVISHVDRYKDVGYHRELLQSGVRVEYDSAFRWKVSDTNWTYLLLEQLLPEFPDQITVGMDAARNSYWHAYGGQPGLTYLVTTFRHELDKRGLGSYWHKVMIENPASLYTFSSR